MSKKSNQKIAAKSDKHYYAEWDDDACGYGVFGDHTGFCYASYADKGEAEEEAGNRNRAASRV